MHLKIKSTTPMSPALFIGVILVAVALFAADRLRFRPFG